MTQAMAGSGNYLLRALGVWFAIMCGESFHGAARVMLLQPRLGDLRARQVAFFGGVAIVFTISCLAVRWIGALSDRQLLATGCVWMLLTLSFELAIAWLAGFSWERILSDYDLSRGGLMVCGMMFLIAAPLLAERVRGRMEGWKAHKHD